MQNMNAKATSINTNTNTNRYIQMHFFMKYNIDTIIFVNTHFVNTLECDTTLIQRIQLLYSLIDTNTN